MEKEVLLKFTIMSLGLSIVLKGLLDHQDIATPLSNILVPEHQTPTVEDDEVTFLLSDQMAALISRYQPVAQSLDGARRLGNGNRKLLFDNNEFPNPIDWIYALDIPDFDELDLGMIDNVVSKASDVVTDVGNDAGDVVDEAINIAEEVANTAADLASNTGAEDVVAAVIGLLEGSQPDNSPIFCRCDRNEYSQSVGELLFLYGQCAVASDGYSWCFTDSSCEFGEIVASCS